MFTGKASLPVVKPLPDARFGSGDASPILSHYARSRTELQAATPIADEFGRAPRARDRTHDEFVTELRRTDRR